MGSTSRVTLSGNDEPSTESMVTSRRAQLGRNDLPDAVIPVEIVLGIVSGVGAT